MPAGPTYGGASSSSSGLRSSSRGATLTQQLSELDIRVRDMEDSLNTHIESTQAWQ